MPIIHSNSIEQAVSMPMSSNMWSPVINVHGVEYCLTAYHKESGQSEWTQVESENVKQLLKDSSFQKLVQQVKLPCSEIEIQACIYPDPTKNSVRCAITENGSKRKIAVSIDESLFTKISHVFEKNIRDQSSHSITKNVNNSFINQWIQDVENSVSHFPYDSLFAKNLLRETQKDPAVRSWLEKRVNDGPFWKNLHGKCDQDVELTAEDLQNFSFCLIDFNDYQFLGKEELLENIKTAMNAAKTELKIVAKPIHEPVLGFNNKSMNCGFNACLQMILNEPVLLDIYKTVVDYYCSRKEKQDQLCGHRMASVLKYYNEASSEKQKAVSREASNDLRLAMHYLSKEVISSNSEVQEDANEILTMLFSSYEDILKQEELIRSLQEYRKALKLEQALATPAHLKAILGTQVITEDLLSDKMENLREAGKEKLLNTSLLHHMATHTTYHKIEKILEDPSNIDYSALNEDDALIKTRTEWNLIVGCNTEQDNLNLVDLLKNHFYNEDVQGSDLRKFMKGKECVEASVIKEEIELSALPNHLFITLERGNNLVKFRDSIEIPEELDAGSLNIDRQPPGSYELKSFIVHLGTSLNGGHYTAYRKVQNQWFACDDSRISQVSREKMLQAAKDCYICFYSLKQD